MSTTDTPTPTTLETQTAATLPEKLPLDGITLLGTLVAGEASRAMLRMKDGEIRHVTVGGQVGKITIAAIEPGLIHMIQNGEAQRLAMP